ncbi:MAG: copper chaperone PCu(A)C [Alphaproteobacteria bacterium]
MRTLIIAFAVTFGLAGTALAQSGSAPSPTPSITVVAPWARATPAGARNGAAYMTIENKGKEADRLLAVTTPIAKMAEMHRTENAGGVMKMLPVDAVDLAAGGQAVFKPGGYHVMLMDLKQPLAEGQSFPMTLSFEKAGRIEVSVKVEKLGASGSGMNAMPHDMGGMKTN